LLPFRDGPETQIAGNAMFKSPMLLTLTLIALLGAPLLGACNTTAGAGKDISKVGDKIEEEAVEHTP
jgi:entericidin A